MLRSRFFWRIYVGYVILILLSASAVGGLVAMQIRADSSAEIDRSLAARVELLCGLVDPQSFRDPVLSLQPTIEDLGERTATRLTLIARDGRVVADSQRDPATMDDHSQRPEIRAAVADGSGSSTRFSHTLGTDMRYLARPVLSDGEIHGYARAALALAVIDRRLAVVQDEVLLAIALSALVAVGLGFLVVRRLSKPITEMTACATRIASGDYDSKLHMRGSDEIATLAHALDGIADASRQRVEVITTDRNKLLAILAGMIEGVIAVDRDQRVTHLNRAAARILGLAAGPRATQALEGRHVWEVTRRTEVTDTLAEAFETASDVRRQLGDPTRSQSQVVEMHASPLRDGDGGLVGAVVVLHDVSELRQLEGIRRDFVANVSHELKTPITAIRGMIETILDDPEMDAKTRERFLGRSREQSRLLSALVSDLLALSRLESADGVHDAELIDLRDAVRVSTAALLPTAEEKSVAVEVDLPNTTIPVSGDAEALRQAFTNLLDNAVKYTPEGGTIQVRLTTDDDDAVVEVEDSGPGISAAHIDRIFERFYRVDKARSRELGGTGLGLSIVKHVCNVHGGAVDVHSDVGRGSRFTVRLPLS